MTIDYYSSSAVTTLGINLIICQHQDRRNQVAKKGVERASQKDLAQDGLDKSGSDEHIQIHVLKNPSKFGGLTNLTSAVVDLPVKYM